MPEKAAVPEPFNKDALSIFAPQAPAGNPWTDYWYYYINDPETGLFKIAFLSFLSHETDNSSQHAYLHIAYAPLTGKKREYDYYSDQLTAVPAINAGVPYAFRFEVPGVALITESSLELNLPEASLSVELTGPHHHYYNGVNPAAGPFRGETASGPPAESHWFIFTLGTEASYFYKDEHSQQEGKGLTYIERGWSSAAAPGFAYMVGTSERAQLMLVKGATGNESDELWAGKIVVGQHELTIVPFQSGYTAESDIDSSVARVLVDITQGEYQVKVTSQAPLGEFYNHITPSLTVFHAENPVMKTMNAIMEIELYQSGQLLESVTIKQTILEFCGPYYCPAMREAK